MEEGDIIICWTKESEHNLTIGVKYEIYMAGDGNTYFYVKDDTGTIDYYAKYYFKTPQEYRRYTINNILK